MFAQLLGTIFIAFLFFLAIWYPVKWFLLPKFLEPNELIKQLREKEARLKFLISKAKTLKETKKLEDQINLITQQIEELEKNDEFTTN